MDSAEYRRMLYRANREEQERRDQWARLSSIREDSICRPAGADDTRVLSVWRCALAAVGVNAGCGDSADKESKFSPLWNEGACYADALTDLVKDRVLEAKRLVRLFRTENPSAGDTQSVRKFIAAVGEVGKFSPPSVPAPAVAPTVSAPEFIVAASASELAPVEAVPVPSHGRRRQPTVQDEIAPYVAKLMKECPGYTAENLHQRMKRDAGGDGSPFSRLTQGGDLFCIECGKTCGKSSVEAALTAYNKRRKSTVGAP